MRVHLGYMGGSIVGAVGERRLITVAPLMSAPKSRRPLTSRCDQCRAPMRLARTEPHPEKEGLLHVFECTQCKMPMVVFSPPASLHAAHRGYELYAVQESGVWNIYVYPMKRGLPELTVEQQLIEHPEQDDALAIARNRIDTILGTGCGNA